MPSEPQRPGPQRPGQQAPRDYEGLRAAIVARRDGLPKRLAQVAAFAVGHPDEIAFGTTASIAAGAGVHPSALIRFSQAMGFDGFTDLQSVFRQHFRARASDHGTRLKALSGTEPGVAQLLESFCAAGERSIAAFRKSADRAALETAVDILSRADTIYLIGMRRSFPVISYMAYAFGTLGVRAVLVDAIGGMTQGVVGCATPADAAFAISFTPYAAETIALAGEAADRRVPVVAVTDSAFSPLARRATAWIEVAEADVEGFRSLSASLALAMTLAVAVAERRRKD